MGPGRYDSILVMFQTTVQGLSHTMWGNEPLGGGLRSFLVDIKFV